MTADPITKRGGIGRLLGVGHRVLAVVALQAGQRAVGVEVGEVAWVQQHGVADQICTEDHIEARRVVRRLMARYAEVEDLVQIGAYAQGSHPESDVAIESIDAINTILRQRVGESSERGLASLVALATTATARLKAS